MTKLFLALAVLLLATLVLLIPAMAVQAAIF